MRAHTGSLAMVGLFTFWGGAIHAAPPAPDYVAQAGAGDLYEKQSSQLVLQTKGSAAVRDFARHMIADHSKSSAMVKAAAAKDGLKPRPPALTAKQKTDLAALRAATGTARYTLYVQQQKMAHQEALTLHSGYAADGDKQNLKTAAAKIAPVVRHHIEMLSKM